MVGGRYVFELKAIKPSQKVQKKNGRQIGTYLDFLRSTNHVIDRAAIIYFTRKGVFVVEVQADGSLAQGVWLVRWTSQLELTWGGGRELA